jgi:hypothetical protein
MGRGGEQLRGFGGFCDVIPLREEAMTYLEQRRPGR